jgi:hypothetical protein
MRMNLFDKFLLALILLLMLAASLFIGCVAASVVPLSVVTNFLDGLTGRWEVNTFIFGGIALLLFIIVIRLFVASYGGDKSQSYTRLSVTENGEIAISIPTIRQITAAFVATKPDIAASSSVIYPAKEGISVRLRICVKEGAILPEVTKAVQKELKAHLETVTGLVILNIKVEVDNNRSSYSGKVR